MNDDGTCYFCGRTNDEVKRYVKKILLAKEKERIERINQKENELEDKHASNKKDLNQLREKVISLPDHIRKMKIVTIKTELENLKTDFPVIEEIIKDFRYNDDSMMQALTKLEEHQKQQYEKPQSELIKQNPEIQERYDMLQKKFEADFNIKMMHISIPIGKQKPNPMQRRTSSVNAIREFMKSYGLSFDEAFTLLSRSSEILQPIIDNRYKYSSDEARHTVMVEALNEDEEIIIEVGEEVLKKLLGSYKLVRGKRGKYDEWRKEFYMPEKIEVPICYICKSMLDDIKTTE